MSKTFDRIAAHPEILNGKPCIKGTRISVQLILEWLASGASLKEIADRHPMISEEDVRQAILYASRFDQNETFVDLKTA